MPLKLLLATHLILFGATDSKKSADLIGKIQASWEKTKSYQASFQQTIRSKKLGTKDESTGLVMVEKPGKIRWETSSEGVIDILNGKRFIHMHVPKRRKAKVVDIYENVSKKYDTRSLAFLAGFEEFKKAYTLKIIEENDKLVLVHLTPIGRKGEEPYIAEFDKSSYLLRSLTTDSADSSVRTEFSDIRTNVSFGEEAFEYKQAPTDVVTINK